MIITFRLAATLVAISLLAVGYVNSNILFYEPTAAGFNYQQLVNAAVGIMFVLLFLIRRVKSGGAVSLRKPHRVIKVGEICILVVLFAGSLFSNIFSSTRIPSGIFYIMFIVLILVKPNIAYRVFQKIIDYSWILALGIMSSVLYYSGFAVSIRRAFSHEVFSLPWDNPNKLAQLLICTIVLLSLRVLIRHKSLTSRLWSVMLIGGLIYILLGTASRAGFLTIGAYAALLLWHLSRKRCRPVLRTLSSVAVIAAITIVLFGVFQVLSYRELQATNPSEFLSKYHIYPYYRFVLWPTTVGIITSSTKVFFFGQGAGDAGISTRAIFPGRFKGDVASPHNSYLALILQFGVLFTGFFFYLCAKILFVRSPPSPED